ncbi:MAG: hypothetical protein ACKO1L_04135 [Brachymonas sp.]
MQNSGSAPTATDPRVDLERVDLLIRGFKLAIVSTLAGPALVAWLFESMIGIWQSWGVVVLVYALHAERFFFFWRYEKARGQDVFAPTIWMRGVAIRLGVMGSVLGLWMLASTLSCNDTAIFYALTLGAIMAAGALTQFCIFAPAVWAFVTPFILGSAFQMMWLGIQGSKLG